MVEAESLRQASSREVSNDAIADSDSMLRICHDFFFIAIGLTLDMSGKLH
jgi:hypothetical protein